MSYMNTSKPHMRNEEMRSAFHSLNHDILRQQGYKPPTPPLTPDSPGLLSSTNHNILPLRVDPTSPTLSSYENRGEPTSVISRYERSRPFTSSSSFSSTDNRYGHSHQWTHNRNGSCSPCPQTSYSDEMPVISSRHYKNAPPIDNYNGSSIGDSVAMFMRTKESMSIDQHVMPTSLKRRFDNGGIDTPAPKRFKLDSRQSAVTENREYVSGQMKQMKTEKVACQVHGITSLPGSREPRYDITKNELERRVNEPECLTKVDMISYVRLAKNSARSLLEKNEIRTNQHNKRSEHTVLSKMCESECQVLAQGLKEINFKYFPGSWFAKKSVQEISREIPSSRQQREALRDRIKEDDVTKCVLLDIFYGLEQRANDDEMKNFNLMSHSFGVTNLKNNIFFLLRYLDEELRMLKSMFTHHV